MRLRRGRWTLPDFGLWTLYLWNTLCMDGAGGVRMFGILGWIIFGLIVGAVAKLLMPGKDPGGIIVTMVLGIVGAVLGGYRRPRARTVWRQRQRGHLHVDSRRRGCAVDLSDGGGAARNNLGTLHCHRFDCRFSIENRQCPIPKTSRLPQGTSGPQPLSALRAHCALYRFGHGIHRTIAIENGDHAAAAVVLEHRFGFLRIDG